MSTTLNLRSLSVLLAMATVLTGCSPQEPAICGAFNEVIDRKIVDIAVKEWEGENDDSAIRANARAAESQQMMSVILSNQELARQHQCKPRTQPLDPSRYRSQAIECLSARRWRRLAMAYPEPDAQKVKETAEAEGKACNLVAWDAAVAASQSK